MNTEVQTTTTISQFTESEIDIIKKTVAKGTTDTELSYFLILAKSLGLNPFNKEIWCYKDAKGNLLTFAGRDGFLVAAQKQPVYNGLRSGYVCANDKVFSMDIPNAVIEHKFDNKPRGAYVGAYAIAFRKGAEATVVWVDFNTFNKGFNAWKSNPGEMIIKVAEAHALKKAFGLSGVDIAETYDFDKETFAQPIDIEHEEEPIVKPEMVEEDLPIEIEAMINEADSKEILATIYNDNQVLHTNKQFMAKLTTRKAEILQPVTA